MQKDSWLYSDSFLKRAFAIWGHNAVAGLIISVPFMIIWAIFVGFMVATFVATPGNLEQKIQQLEQMDQMEQQP